MKILNILFGALMLIVCAAAIAQQHGPGHSHYETPEVIDGLSNPERLPHGAKIQYVLKARLGDLMAEMSEEDSAIIAAGVEKMNTAEEAQKTQELEEFDYMCRNLSSLDIESIIQIIDKPHLNFMNNQESVVGRHLSRLSKSGRQVLNDMIETTDYHVQVVQANNAEYARKHPVFFRSSLSDKCAAYLSSVE